MKMVQVINLRRDFEVVRKKDNISKSSLTEF